jgi:integrase
VRASTVPVLLAPSPRQARFVAWRGASTGAGQGRDLAATDHAASIAQMQLEHGTSIRALAEYLGHHDPGFTLRTYTHLMPASEDRARQAIDLLLGEPATSWERARPPASV